MTPDFIVVDGKEGGTGAAPLEFTDHLGMPMREGLTFVRNALIGAGLRERIRIGCSGKIVTAFDMAAAFALGADWCNSARGFMFSLGCIQSLSCHTDHCPTGVATQDPTRYRALVVEDKTDARRQFPRRDAARARRTDRRGGPRTPAGFPPRAFFAPGQRARGRSPSPSSIPRWSRANCLRARATRSGGATGALPRPTVLR